MFKHIRGFTVLIILLTQFIYPFQVLYAVTENHGFSIKSMDEHQELFNLTLDNTVDYDEIKIELPEDINYDLFDLKHKLENNNNLTIEKKDISNSIIPIKLVNGKSETIQFSFGVYKDNVLIDRAEYETTRQKKDNQINLQRETLLPENNNVTTAPDLQRFLSVSPIFETVESGNDALYKIRLTTTGSQVNYTNVKLKVNLPTDQWTSFEQDVSELAIANVIPIYNTEKNQLVYEFDELKSGQTYETVVNVKTTNGYMKNNTRLKLVANLSFSDRESLDLSKESSITVNASNATTITKEVVEQKLNNVPSLPTPGADITWKIKVGIPYKKTGQMFLKEGDKITVQDILPNGLEFIKATQGGKELSTIKNKNNLTWKFDIPSIEKQKLSADNLFQTEILVYTKINKDNKLIGKSIENKAVLDTLFIDEQVLNPKKEALSSIKVYKSPGDTTTIEGTIIAPTHYGPADSEGNFATNEELNPNKTFDDSAYLGFRHSVRSGRYGAERDLNKLSIIYTIDEHLYLDRLILPSDDKWVLGRTIAETQLDIPLAKNPTYKLVLSFVRNGKEDTVPVENPKKNIRLSLEDLGLEKGDRVTEVKYIFDSPIPMGFANRTMSRYLFTVEPGYVGEVKNKFDMIGESSYNHKTKPTSYSTSNKIPFNNRSDAQDGAKELAGDRTAQIVKKKSGEPPIAKISIELDKHENGVVGVGKNKMNITYSSPTASTGPISEKLESVVLLPPGVSISEKQNDKYFDNSGQAIPGTFKIIDKNFNNTNRQLVKFEWKEKYIRPSQKLTAEVDIDISSKAPSSLYFDVYGFSGDKKLEVPETNKAVLTDTILQTDLDDLNKDGKTDTPRIKSSNVYTILNTYDLKTEKFVKGPGEEWSKFAKTTPGGEIDYRLFLTNSTGKDISSMTLIDVLPAGGDLGITDNISRGSKFMPYLSGKINLPKEWQGKVKVYYSTSKNPKRDDLIRHTNYPNDTTPLGNPNGATDPKWMSEDTVKDWTSIRSFKIELIPGAVWIKGVDMNITFNMEAPTVERASNKGIFNPKVDPQERAAWNSFAVATDNGQPVEPQQVGVYIDKDIGQLQIKKVDSETGNVLSGAEFKISSEDGSFVKTMVSNEEGIAELKDIPLGKYTIMETKAPNGYNLSQEKVTIEVTNDTYDHQITIKNQRIKGNITVKKVDSITGKTLSGAVFEIKNSKGDVIKTLTTDDKGLANISDLPDDKYTITEIKAPDGYNLLQKSIDVEINSKDSNVTVTVKNTAIGWELPETGGSGMLLFSVIGLLFMSVGFSFMRIRRY